MRVLVVEDDATTAKLTRLLLTEEGYAVDVASTGEEGRTLAMLHEYDAIVLDLGLADRNGLEILVELRRRERDTPVLVLTARAGDEDIVRALDAGADDYVVKPVSNNQFRARVRALVRRGGARRTEVVAAGQLTLNRLTRRVTVRGEELPLTQTEYRILEYLLARRDEVVPRSDLFDKVWDMHFDPGSNVIAVHMGRLRRKLDEMRAGVDIEPVRGVGYRLSAADDAADAAGSAERGAS